MTMSQPRPFGMVDLVILLLFAVGAISAAVWEDHWFVRNQIDRRSQSLYQFFNFKGASE